LNPSRDTRETRVLAAAVAAVPLLLAAGIGVVPQLHSLWLQVTVIAAMLAIGVIVGVRIVRSARNLLLGQSADADVVKYEDDRETGVLLKGKIANVSLRVSTMHRIVDTLTLAIPEGHRQRALYDCGCDVGKNWVADFRHELPRLEIAPDDLLRQLLKWSEYDATAGMGRLTVVVNPRTGDGLIGLANGFLSRAAAGFPLNWWFAGYLAGTLHELLGQKVDVEVIDPTAEASATTFFRVTPAHDHQRRVARTAIWRQSWQSRLDSPP
jgi:hypothetical protein